MGGWHVFSHSGLPCVLQAGSGTLISAEGEGLPQAQHNRASSTNAAPRTLSLGLLHAPLGPSDTVQLCDSQLQLEEMQALAISGMSLRLPCIDACCCTPQQGTFHP